jgi:hypothetical protein
MKTIIASLLCLQMIVVGFMISMAVEAQSFDQFLYAEKADVDIIFVEESQGLEKLMNTVAEHGVMMTRVKSMSYEDITLYTTDVSFEGYIKLREGRFPEIGNAEFISNVVYNDDNQVGLIANLTPRFNITIRPIEDQEQLQLDGQYRIHTIDTGLLSEIADNILDDTHLFRIARIMEDDRDFLDTMTMGILIMPTLLITTLVITTPIVAFLCIVATLLCRKQKPVSHYMFMASAGIKSLESHLKI